jgi:hypothetical protein
MSFDALTISGVLAALISTGLIVGIVCNNDPLRDKCRRKGRADWVQQGSSDERTS